MGSTLLPIHIAAGALGLLSGYVALAATKGATLHRKSGMLFVWVMLTMATTGFLISASRGVAPAINVPTALLTFYLVVTGLTTVRTPAIWSRSFDVAAMVMAIAIGAGCVVLALVSIAAGGAQAGMAYPLFMFGAVALGAAAGDRRVLKDGAPGGASRIKRHLWRMCFGLFISSIAFYLGPDRLPLALRNPAFRAAGVLLPLVAMTYWLWRLRKRGRGSFSIDQRNILRSTTLATASNSGESQYMIPDPFSRKPLRVWPAVVLLALQIAITLLGPYVLPESDLPLGLMGSMLCAVLILVWWLLFSRARWYERVGAVLLMVTGILVTRLFSHISIVGAGQGMLAYILPVMFLPGALAIWAAATRNLKTNTRYATLPIAFAIVLVPFAMIRTDGVMGSGMQFHLRWTPTAEEKLLAQAPDDPKPISAAVPAEPAKATPPVAVVPVPSPAPAPATPAVAPAVVEAVVDTTPVEWSGFRGPNRDSVIHDVRIKTDWTASPPVEIWRRAVGPGWSSFAVHGDLIFTQEQRGNDEIVSCYRLSTGEPVWRHRDPVRFYESNGGAGPRATPTLAHGRVYTSGATGILNALDEKTGATIWSHKVADETQTPTPMWGFSASPLVIDNIVIAAASGALAAYDAISGKPLWANKSKGGSYSSPHRVTIDGVEQVLLLGGPAVMSVNAADGKLLWEHKWDGGAIVQPGITPDGGVLINAMSMTGGVGTRRLAVTKGDSGWTVEERWTSNGLKPYYNDFVIHKGNAYGFDNNILSSIKLEDGTRNWKGGRYGNGQLVLLADQDLMLVISEEGELALVSATPDKFTEVARFHALDAKTWNHPVVVGSTLLVRNGEEMKAYRLALETAQTIER